MKEAPINTLIPETQVPQKEKPLPKIQKVKSFPDALRRLSHIPDCSVRLYPAAKPEHLRMALLPQLSHLTYMTTHYDIEKAVGERRILVPGNFVAVVGPGDKPDSTSAQLMTRATKEEIAPVIRRVLGSLPRKLGI